MAEYNAMTKEYELMKLETSAIQSRSLELHEAVSMQESKIIQMEQHIQVLEAENNELRQGRIIDASTSR